MYVSPQSLTLYPKRLLALGIASKKSLEFGWISHLIHADVDHGGARLHEVACDHSGAADSCNQDIGAAAHTRKIASFRVANGHRGVAVDKQHGNGLPD